jgi:hypothetical protein
MVYIFDCIYIPAHQAAQEILQHDYDNTLTALYQIKRNVRSICQQIESLNSLYSPAGM